MDHVSLRLFLLCVLHSLYFNGHLMRVVSSEPSATVWIVTAERNRKIGGRVEMRCVATNLEENHVVELETLDPTPVSLRWCNLTNAGRDPRFVFETKQTDIGEITQEFNVTNLQLKDSNKYACNVREILQSGGSEIITNSTVRLRVYSSNESFPICSPEGPITVNDGTHLIMQCSADTGEPRIGIFQSGLPQAMASNYYLWSSITSGGLSSRSLDVIVDVTDDNLRFVCTISSMTFHGETHYCIIGPINVRGVLQSPTTKDTTRKPNPTTGLVEPCPLAPWIAVSVVSIVLLVLSCIITLLLTLQLLKQRRLVNSLIARTSLQMPISDPYMELKPTSDSNTAYTEPVTKGSTNTRHTYYNTLDIENEKIADDYEQPEDKYEAVGAPKKDENKI